MRCTDLINHLQNFLNETNENVEVKLGYLKGEGLMLTDIQEAYSIKALGDIHYLVINTDDAELSKFAQDKIKEVE